MPDLKAGGGGDSAPAPAPCPPEPRVAPWALHEQWGQVSSKRFVPPSCLAEASGAVRAHEELKLFLTKCVKMWSAHLVSCSVCGPKHFAAYF